MSDSTISEAISAAIAPILEENARLQESLGDALASLKFEDRGWLRLFGLDGNTLEGLDLDEVKEISEKMRIKTALGGLYKRGVDLHTGYVWARGINIPGVKKSGGRGNPGKLVDFYDKNKEVLFNATAQAELQKTRYTDGNIFLLCEPNQKVRIIPLKEIVNIKVNPDFPSEVWAYLRQWTPDSTEPQPKVEKRWYYTKRYDGVKQLSYDDGAGGRIEVGAGVIVDVKFNSQTGWVLGIPDVAAAAPWVEAYNEIMQYGRVVNESLSKLLFKIINPNKKAAQNSAARVAGMKGNGNTVSMVDGADVQAVSTAGKGYDFTSARPVGAEAAAALNVSLAEFLSDTSAAGSSYGALAALAPSVQNAMVFMQKQFMEMYSEVFDAYGISAPEMSFDAIVEPDLYRQAQALTLLSTTLTDPEYRGEALDMLNIDGKASTIPPTLAARSQAARQAASPDQGQNGPAGAADSGSLNDQRSDLIANAMNTLNLDRLEELVMRLENINLQA